MLQREGHGDIEIFPLFQCASGIVPDFMSSISIGFGKPNLPNLGVSPAYHTPCISHTGMVPPQCKLHTTDYVCMAGDQYSVLYLVMAPNYNSFILLANPSPSLQSNDFLYTHCYGSNIEGEIRALLGSDIEYHPRI